MRRPSREGGLVALMFALLAAAWSFTIPPGEAPDEREHLRYAQFLREHSRLPTASDIRAQELHEGFQPPLYHLLLAGWGALIGFDLHRIVWIENPRFDRTSTAGRASEFDHAAMRRSNAPADLLRFRVMRLPNVVFGALVVLLSLHAARALGAGGPGSVVVVLAASTPLFASSAGAISSDIPAALFGALAVYALAQARQRPRWTQTAALAIGLGLLTKATLLFLWIGLLAAVWLQHPRLKPTRERLSLALVPLPFAAWSLGRTLQLESRYQDVERVGSMLANPVAWFASWGITAVKTLYHSLSTAVGVVGVHAIWMPGVVYGVVLAVAAVIAFRWARDVRRIDQPARALSIGGWLACLFLFLAAMYWYRETGYSMHGRLYLPMLPAVAVGMSAAWREPAPFGVSARTRLVLLGAGAVLLFAGMLPGELWNGAAGWLRDAYHLEKPARHYAAVIAILFSAAGAFLATLAAAWKYVPALVARAGRDPATQVGFAAAAVGANLLILFFHVRFFFV